MSQHKGAKGAAFRAPLAKEKAKATKPLRRLLCLPPRKQIYRGRFDAKYYDGNEGEEAREA